MRRSSQPFMIQIRNKVPDARIVIAGVPERHIKSLECKNLLQAVAEHARGKAQAIDLHYHTSWLEGSAIDKSIAALRAVLATVPSLKDIDIVVAENSTWFDRPTALPQQTDVQQAVYAVESVYTALSAGAKFCVFGTLMDRSEWKGKEKPHKFNLNGLFYNSRKTTPTAATAAQSRWPLP